MKRYFKLLKAMAALSAKRYLEHRANTFGGMLGSLITLFIDLLFIKITFSFGPSINGWHYNQVLIIFGVSRIILSLIWVFLQRGVSYMSQYIRNGDLDFLLTKPVNTQFFVSLRFIRIYDTFGIITGITILAYALSQSPYLINPMNLSVLLVNIVCGFIVFYAIFFSIATLSFWVVNFNSLGVIYYMMGSLVSLPTNIYGKGISFVLTYLFLLGMIVTIPVKVIIDQNFYLLALEISVAMVSLYFCIWFWNFALKHYTSASS